MSKYYYFMVETVKRRQENESRDVHVGGYETLDVMLTEALLSRDAVEFEAQTEVRSWKRNHITGFSFAIYQFANEEAADEIGDNEELAVEYICDEDGQLVLIDHFVSGDFDLEGIDLAERL